MAKIQSWEVSDQFWDKVEPLIPTPARDPGKTYRRKAVGGRKPIPSRRIFEAIIYVMRTGCQWQALPKERFGSPNAIHAHFIKWLRAGFFAQVWQAGLAEHDDMEGIAWLWQSIDGAMVKAPPTDRGKEKNQAPCTGGRLWRPATDCRNRASRHDVPQLGAVLDEIMIHRPDDVEQDLCADKGYAGGSSPKRNQRA